MKQASLLLVAVAVAFALAYRVLGYDAVYRIGYGALAMMAAMISATFAALWSARATPLALGMAFSWAGAAATMGWWWLFKLLGEPGPMVDSGLMFGFLSLYFVGAILHFGVIQRSLGLPREFYALPVAGALVLSTAFHLR